MLFRSEEGHYRKRESDIVIVERPPILGIPEYRSKFPDRAAGSHPDIPHPARSSTVIGSTVPAASTTAQEGAVGA